MKSENFNQMSKEAYEAYKKNITKEQKTLKNMFLLGHQASTIEHSQLIKELQHYKDNSFALLKTDKEPKQIADAITKMLSEHLELKSVDSFDVRENITTYLSSVLFRF